MWQEVWSNNVKSETETSLCSIWMIYVGPSCVEEDALVTAESAAERRTLGRHSLERSGSSSTSLYLSNKHGFGPMGGLMIVARGVQLNPNRS